MKQEIIKSELEVNDNKIKVITIDNKEFIKENLLNQNDTLYLQLGREGRFNTMF